MGTGIVLVTYEVTPLFDLIDEERKIRTVNEEDRADLCYLGDNSFDTFDYQED